MNISTWQLMVEKFLENNPGWHFTEDVIDGVANMIGRSISKDERSKIYHTLYGMSRFEKVLRGGSAKTRKWKSVK